ncbi:unnamed protein product [Lactuca virosa]|uniref:Ubiquitin-like domain-containing protein n=1 Tax=Lactuca virosa TaxID=75947 RepID=A0AAU9P5L1_9ASTR|nr:unnamed protein product [Lactuca virosa]
MLIDVEGNELKVTTQSVHDMLGIPKGGTILTQLDQWPKDDTSYDEWKQQFQEGSIIRLNAIKKVILFYADNIHSEALTVTCKCLTICYWSSEKIRYRETFEQEECRFGLGELNEEFVNEQDEGDTDLEDSDSDKDEEQFVEAYESKISKMLNSFERMKEKLNSKLNDAITKFPEKESQKTNDQKENEDKEGNGEEHNDNDESQPEVDYLFDSNEAVNEGIKNDGDKNKKEG